MNLNDALNPEFVGLISYLAWAILGSVGVGFAVGYAVGIHVGGKNNASND